MTLSRDKWSLQIGMQGCVPRTRTLLSIIVDDHFPGSSVPILCQNRACPTRYPLKKAKVPYNMSSRTGVILLTFDKVMLEKKNCFVLLVVMHQTLSQPTPGLYYYFKEWG